MPYALIPNFSVPLTPIHDDRDRVPFHADPVLAAIDVHQEAWNVFQVVAEDEPSIRAEEAMASAMDALLGTPCATRFGAFALLRHLRWWLGEEAEFADSYQPAYSIAQARESDLTLLLGADGVSRIPIALPCGRLSGPAPLSAARRILIEAGPVPAPALVRLGRAVASAGELLACLVLVAGGCALTGIATLI